MPIHPLSFYHYPARLPPPCAFIFLFSLSSILSLVSLCTVAHCEATISSFTPPKELQRGHPIGGVCTGLQTLNPYTLQAQGGLQDPLGWGATEGLAPKPFVTWGGAHWHPTLVKTYAGRIHVKICLQNITLYLKYDTENV